MRPQLLMRTLQRYSRDKGVNSHLATAGRLQHELNILTVVVRLAQHDLPAVSTSVWHIAARIP